MVRISLNENKIRITGVRPKISSQFRTITGVYVSGDTIVMPQDWVLMELALARLPGAQITQGARAWLNRNRGIDIDFDVPLVTVEKMHEYQHEGAFWLASRKRAVLADSPGLGKTLQAIVAAEMARMRLERPIRILVLCKNSYRLNWQAEIKRWTGRRADVIEATGRQAKLDEWTTSRTGYLIVGWTTFRVFEELLAIGWDVVIADESHVIKNHKTKTFKLFRRISTEYLFLLSATPFSLHNGEIWTSLHMIDKRKFSSFWRFFQTFVLEVMIGQFPKIVGNKNSDVLVRVIANYMLRRTADDVGFDNLPPAVQTVDVPMHAKQANLYLSMHRRMRAELEGTSVTAPTPLSKLTRLRQIASTTQTLWEMDHSGKLQAVMDYIEDTPDQLVVATRYRATVKALHERLVRAKIPAVILMGGENSQSAQQVFQEGKAKVLVMTIGAGGESLSLHAANTMLILERPWNPMTEEQLEGRIYRPALQQQEAKRIIYLEHPGTIDKIVSSRVIKRKIENAGTLAALLRQQEAVLEGGSNEEQDLSSIGARVGIDGV